jgi:SAM-dependent methyltransferase
MAHYQQLSFVSMLTNGLAKNYSGKKILEIGSYDVSGSVRSYFPGSDYTGLDLAEGPGVDIVCGGSDFDDPSEKYDLTISCECFEHNPFWFETFLNMHRLTKKGGVLIFTCASKGRLEHGTTRTTPLSSPGSQSLGWDYYKNLEQKDFEKKVDFDSLFSNYEFIYYKKTSDLYFYGVKRGESEVFNKVLDIRSAFLDIRSAYMSRIKMTDFIRAFMYIPLTVASAFPDKHYQNFAFKYLKDKEYI